MKLINNLIKCPPNYRFNTINNYFPIVKSLFEKVLYNIDLTSYKKEIHDYNHATISNSSKLNQINDIKTYLKSTNNTVYKPFTDCIFISTRLMHSIVTKHTILEKVIGIYNTNRVNMWIYNENSIDCFNDRVDISIKMTKILTFLELLNLENYEIDIYYAPVDIPKIFPKSKKFTPDNINSGGTIHYLNNVHIVLFRKEESDKVLLHELVHCLKLDFSMSETYWENKSLINREILNSFNISQNEKYINLFEALTDSIAIIFNSIFNCILTKSNINDYFYTELLYGRTVANNILIHAGYKDIEDFLTNKSTKELKQSTSVLAYYILKCSLLNNSDTILIDFFPKFYIEWTIDDIYRLYSLTKKDIHLIVNLLKNIDSKSLRMTYNSLKYE